MGRIQSNIGLITGLPILDTVDQLMAIQARPREMIATRAGQIVRQQEAVASLTAKVLAVQLSARRLANEDVFEAKTASSSRPELIQVTTTGNPAAAQYRLTPVRRAETHQMLSTGFSSIDEPIGAGEFTFRFGGSINEGVGLDELNEGRGVRRGQIRITDRSGTSAEIDLRFAKTIDDVLDAINSNQEIAVTVVTNGDSLQLVDGTGQTASNLKVEEVGAGSTATDLGLAGINAAADEASGLDLLSLHEDLALDRLNDGNGLSISSVLPDLTVNFRDGNDPLLIDFHKPGIPAQQASAPLMSANGTNASLTIDAVEVGETYDGVQVSFIDDDTVSRGSETVVYDDTDPQNKTLIFNIESGATTAGDIITALADDSEVSQLFTAQKAAGGDGSGLIDLTDTDVTAGGAAVDPTRERTLGDLMETINAADPTRLQAELSADNDRLILHDLTGDLGGEFLVESAFGGTLAEDLGLGGTPVDGVLTSGRLLAGLKTTLLRSLNGGQGLGELGEIQLVDRSGVAATVDLADAETVEDILRSINASAVGITASVNSAGDGILLTDTTGQTGNLIVANGDATNTADKLGLAADVAQQQVSSGSLQRQVVNEATLLDSYNGSTGVAAGSIVIVDSDGKAKSFRVNPETFDSVGELMEAINLEDFGVTARINDTGDGIALIDSAEGVNDLEVREVGGGTTARDLRLTGEVTSFVDDGAARQLIDGSSTFTVDISDTDTLSDVVQRVNELEAGVVASIINDGGGTTPYRLTLRSVTSGAAGEMLVDTDSAGFAMHEVVAAQDALLLYGSAESTGAGILVASSSNHFDGMIDGITLTLMEQSTESAEVTVQATDNKLVSEVQLFVDQYNALRDTLDEMTAYNPVDNITGVLFGSGETLRIENELSRVLTGRFFDAGSIRSLEEVGVSVGETGKIELDTAKLKAKFAEDPEAVSQFFVAEDTGVAARFDAVVESLAGRDRSLLVNRSVTLQSKYDVLVSRIDVMDVRLEKQRERLLLDFYRMEMAIGKMQSNLSALSAINASASSLYSGSS